MIIDLNELEPDTVVRSAVCVVGCGAVGMAMARELTRYQVDMVLVEAGTEHDEAPTQGLYDCEIVGLPFIGATAGRFRVVGGSTTRWGGQALPMDPIDFEPRDWVAHSGWPFGIDAVARYYARAAEYMDVDSGDYAEALARNLGAIAPNVDRRLLDYHFSKWAPRPNLRELYLPGFRRARSLRLLTHANVTRIDLTDNGSVVKRLVVRSLQGASAHIESRLVVLCAGGIENARLLLSNNHQLPAGIGNRHDLVGRFLQDHPTARAGTIEPSNPRQLQRAFNVFYRRGRKYAVRLSASETFQRAHRSVNLSSGIAFQAPADSGVAAIRRVVHRRRAGDTQTGRWRELSALTRSAASLMQPAYEYLVRGRQYVPGATYVVHVISEQEPDPSSRVSLADGVDALGIRKARIDWRLTPTTGRSIRLFAQALRSEFDRLGLGRFSLAPWLTTGDADWRSQISDANHHIGTTRMSEDPQRGVVDPNCKVHGIDNLYLGGSSVFPTGGHSNPTFTALALSYRNCDELRRRLTQ